MPQYRPPDAAERLATLYIATFALCPLRKVLRTSAGGPRDDEAITKSLPTLQRVGGRI